MRTNVEQMRAIVTAPPRQQRANVAYQALGSTTLPRNRTVEAEALASYARMSDDDSLRQMADRIQARAVRRCGELLKQFDGKGNNQHSGGAPPSSLKKKLLRRPACRGTKR